MTIAEHIVISEYNMHYNTEISLTKSFNKKKTLLSCLYYGIAYSSSGTAFHSSLIASCSLAKQCSRGETCSTLPALFLTSAQSYINLHSLQQTTVSMLKTKPTPSNP